MTHRSGHAHYPLRRLFPFHASVVLLCCSSLACGGPAKPKPVDLTATGADVSTTSTGSGAGGASGSVGGSSNDSSSTTSPTTATASGIGGAPSGSVTSDSTTTGMTTTGTTTGGAFGGMNGTGGADDGAVSTTGAYMPCLTGSTPVGRHGQLQVLDGKLSDECGQAITLRGHGFGWDNYWPQYYNANVVSWLKEDWCVDMVRPAMGIEPDGAYLQNPSASRSRIQAVVDAAIAEELYVIIDWHAHDLHQNEAVQFFSDMAQTYGAQPNVIYEVFNEPEEDETWSQVKSYAEAVISAIRQHDPDNVIIVGNPEWDQRIDLVAEDPITSDSNLIYSVHFYAATHGKWLRDRTAAAIAQGIPVLVSESSGSEATGLGANDYGEWEAWFDFMDENQISWIHYSISDKEGETISVLEPGASANGGWGANELTETGEYVRDVLRGYCE